MMEAQPIRPTLRAWILTTGLACLLAVFVWSSAVIVGGSYELMRPFAPLEEAVASFEAELTAADTLTDALGSVLANMQQRARRRNDPIPLRDVRRVFDSLATQILWDSASFSGLAGLAYTRPDERAFLQMLAALSEERRALLVLRQPRSRSMRDSLTLYGIASMTGLASAIAVQRTQSHARTERIARLSERLDGESSAARRKIFATALAFPASLLALNLRVSYALTGAWNPFAKRAPPVSSAGVGAA